VISRGIASDAAAYPAVILSRPYPPRTADLSAAYPAVIRLERLSVRRNRGIPKSVKF
jgi:hypothetical protein